DTDKFNEVTLLSEWASEQASTKGLGIGSQQARINEIAKKHDTRYFLWLDVIEVKGKSRLPKNIISHLSTFLITPFILPSIIRDIASPQYYTAMYATLYDVKTGRTYPLKRKVFAKKTNDMVLYSQLYDALRQIKVSK
ncbi:MAG: hypothetical protein ACKVTZ_22885, partial [Bacteroidia bacterium]